MPHSPEDPAHRLHEAALARLRTLAGLSPAGRVIEDGDAVAAVTGAAGPYFNVAMTRGAGAGRERFQRVLTALAASGLPHSARLRIGPDDALIGGPVGEMDLTPYGGKPVPGLVLMETSTPDPPPGLEIRSGGDVYEDHLLVAATSFGIPLPLLSGFLSPGVRDHGAFMIYAGYVDNEVVATSLAFVHHRVVHIANVATLPGHRGAGFGSAMTLAAARDGWRRGCDMASLEAGEMSRRLYRRLGFRPVISYEIFRTSPQAVLGA